MSDYAWTIDRDHLDGVTSRDAGVSGPSTAPKHLLNRLANTEGIHFRMLDDDGILYYSGRLVCQDQEDEVITTRDGAPHFLGRIVTTSPDEHQAFGPLWDFGAPNAGCTEIQFMDGAHDEWGSL